MFVAAGFREDYEVLARGRVSVLGGAGVTTAILVRWGAEDAAWLSRSRAVRPDRVVLYAASEEEGNRLLSLGLVRRFFVDPYLAVMNSST